MLGLAFVFLINIVLIRARHFLVGGQRSCMLFWSFFLKNDIFQIDVCGMGQICHKFLEFGRWTSHKTGEQIGRAVWAVVLATHQMRVC